MYIVADIRRSVSGFRRSPRLTKGALISIDMLNPIPRVITFQYNPDSLTRSLQPQAMGGEGSTSEVLRLKGPPVETISLEIELDATDQLEHPDQNPDTVRMGINPQLVCVGNDSIPKELHDNK